MTCADCGHSHESHHFKSICLAAIPERGYQHGQGQLTTGIGRSEFRSVCPCNACQCERCRKPSPPA